jgi:hypothetical protein
MKYYDLLKELKKFDKVVVSGPQRSGTTIAMKQIAVDLGYRPVKEESFFASNLMGFFYCLQEKKIVIQAPAMSYILGELCEPDTAVVFMLRDYEEIKKSEKRVNWDQAMSEANKYFSYDEAGISELKYKIWSEFQKPKLKDRAFELNYDELVSLPLYVKQRARLKFHSRQTFKHESE